MLGTPKLYPQGSFQIPNSFQPFVSSKMSGFEAAGVLLGVLPLLVSAIEHYDDVLRPLQRFKDYAPELSRFQRRILAQKTIFRSQCQLLLVPITDHETANDMLDGPKHQEWSSKHLKAKLEQQLGYSAKACAETIKDIEDQLSIIQEKAEGFGLWQPVSSESLLDGIYILKIELQTGNISKKAWRTRMKGKLKFSVSQSCIEDSIRQLRDLNQDFTALSDQTSKLLATRVPNSSLVNSFQAIKQCQRIKKASTHLFEGLRVACSLHTEHQAHIQVEKPLCGQSEQLLEHSDVHFCLGISRKADDPTKRGTPMWLVVRSIFESVPKQDQSPRERREALEALSRLGANLKRVQSSCGCSNNQKRIKMENAAAFKVSPLTAVSCCAQETCPSNSICTTPANAGDVETIITEPSETIRPGPNFCNAQNLCKHILHINQGAANVSSTYIGHLAKSSLTHDLYLENQGKYAEKSRSLQSLQDWMKSISERDRTDRVPVLECLRLARNLALLVLQFHTTPLLRESWDGKDIEFFDLGLRRESRTYGDGEMLPRPFLKFEVSPTCILNVAASESSHPSEQALPIRNKYLFRLGVIFLELAYQIPFSSLISRSKHGDQTEYEMADHYSRSVGSILGPRYAKIVRKCIGCDFGQDVDLSSLELEAAVHRHVITELDELVHGFEKKIEIAE